MLISTDIKELQQLAKRFYTITKTTISIYDSERNPLCHYPEQMRNFCSLLRTNKELNKICIESDNIGFRICSETRKTYIYKCHMGLIEVVTPIIYGNIIIGYMLFGQITDKKDISELEPLVLAAAKEYGLNADVLLGELTKIKRRNKDYIESMAVLLEMCANYIWLNSIMSVKNDGIAYSIDMYIREHLKDALTVTTLCREFGLGRSTLYELSKMNFKCSITEHVQNCRISHACELLKNKNATVSEVAETVGIKDTNYFIRFFKNRMGITPKQYQKRCAT